VHRDQQAQRGANTASISTASASTSFPSAVARCHGVRPALAR